MTTMEKQHFLSAAYLKHFSPNSGRLTRKSRIWRFDGAHNRFVTAESQCFEKFFYSMNRADEAERMFGGLEAAYDACMRKIKARQRSTQRDYIALILMIFDLHLRNRIYENLTGKEELDAYLARLSGLKCEIAAEHSVAPPDDKVLAALKANWRVRIIDVADDHQFITSDNPSMWFTLGKADHILDCAILPLSPLLIAVAADQRYVQLTGRQATPRDVELLNLNQCYRACRCVFSAQKLDIEQEKFVARALGDRQIGRPRTEAAKGDMDTLHLTKSMLSFLHVSA